MPALSRIGHCDRRRDKPPSRGLRPSEAPTSHMPTKGSPDMKVTQHLWFEKDMEAAIGFYTSLIPGSSLHWISGIPADTPSGPAGSVRIAAFTLGDQRY